MYRKSAAALKTRAGRLYAWPFPREEKCLRGFSSGRNHHTVNVPEDKGRTENESRSPLRLALPSRGKVFGLAGVSTRPAALATTTPGPSLARKSVWAGGRVHAPSRTRHHYAWPFPREEKCLGWRACPRAQPHSPPLRGSRCKKRPIVTLGFRHGAIENGP
jgi:hypothetical protein